MTALFYSNILAFFYSFRYGTFPFLIILSNLDNFQEYIPNSLHSPINVVISALLLLSACLTFYRTYIVYDLLSSTNSTMIEAHNNSKTILNLKLSYIPIIGCIFKKKE